MLFLAVVLAALPALHASSGSFSFSSTSYDPSHILRRSVVVLGGGSTGTYAAISLHSQNISLAVVERSSRLGGHTHSYFSPGTNQSTDTGVIFFHNRTLVRDYFSHLGVPFAYASLPPANVTKYADFRTGLELNPTSLGNSSAGVQAYLQQAQKYPYVEEGFDLPDPIPEDLLLSFEEFVDRYPATAPAVPVVYGFAQGYGDLLRLPMLYVFKIGVAVISNALAGSFLWNPDHDNSALYRSALNILGEDVLLNATILGVQRGEDGVKVVVDTPQGRTLILADKLLSTIPPKLENLSGWDLSSAERDIFGVFKNTVYCTGLLKNSGIPADTAINNLAANGTLLEQSLPALPALYGLNPSSINDLINTKFGSPYPLSSEEVQTRILETVERLRATGIISGQPNGTVEIVGFENHNPFEMTVETERIREGFYQELYGLQGQRRTWWTGAAWHAHDSSLLWAFTEGVLSGLLEA